MIFSLVLLLARYMYILLSISYKGIYSSPLTEHDQSLQEIKVAVVFKQLQSRFSFLLPFIEIICSIDFQKKKKISVTHMLPLVSNTFSWKMTPTEL